MAWLIVHPSQYGPRTAHWPRSAPPSSTKAPLVVPTNRRMAASDIRRPLLQTRPSLLAPDGSVQSRDAPTRRQAQPDPDRRPQATRWWPAVVGVGRAPTALAAQAAS